MEFELRPWQRGDIQSVAQYADNRNVARYLRDAFPNPYTHSDAEQYVESCMQNEGNGQCTRAIVISGKASGSIGVFCKGDVYRKSAEIGYWLAENFWNRGVMSAAIRQTCALAFARFNIVRIFAEPFADNIGSRKALEKAGFEREGVLKKSVYKYGRFYDSCVYALLRETENGR